MKWGWFAGIAVVLMLVMFYGVQYETGSYQKSLIDYEVPNVTLINQSGEPVDLQAFLSLRLPILLEFTFTSCTTLCPSQAVMFSNFQKRLEPEEEVRLVSITVDPEIDTPDVLKTYLQHYHARQGWDFLTGSKADIHKVMDAFGYHPIDMVTNKSRLLLRSAKNTRWTRIDGQLDTQSLLNEYQILTR